MGFAVQTHPGGWLDVAFWRMSDRKEIADQYLCVICYCTGQWVGKMLRKELPHIFCINLCVPFTVPSKPLIKKLICLAVCMKGVLLWLVPFTIGLVLILESVLKWVFQPSANFGKYPVSFFSVLSTSFCLWNPQIIFECFFTSSWCSVAIVVILRISLKYLPSFGFMRRFSVSGRPIKTSFFHPHRIVS